jgi:MFS family permease
LLSGAASIGCVAFSLIGLFSPDIFGWKSPNPFLVNIGLVVLMLFPLLWIFGLLAHLRSAHAYRTTLPKSMNVRIEIVESDDVDIPTKYFAVFNQGETGSGEGRIRVRTTAKLEETTTSGLVFFDPDTNEPLVIEIDGKRLWAW